MIDIKKQKAKRILRELKKLVPDARMILNYSNPWECLVAVQLSAQCTDVQVNKVTGKLFKKYRTFTDYLDADPRQFEKDIFSTGFYKNKTKNILAAARIVQREFGGRVPGTMNELVCVPGVARKTANVVLGNCYGVFEGVAVDTHVRRLSRLFGLTKHTDPNTIEKDLMALFPQKDWFSLTYYFIEYGRRFCSARIKDHTKCPLAHYEV
ncbi:endonuclease III [Candidatus Uhrbacteria bacterium]|nr:endonuclease III [Candidatus Uhrbacteria bacterium]